MATPRDIRKLAFQALYQLDVRGEATPEELTASVAAESELSTKAIATAVSRAIAAYKDRAKADKMMEELAPGWPAYRQAAVDRAILRLAHWEMTSGLTSPKIVVNEAVELAKAFSTDKSPAFVNGLLDKVLKQVVAAGITGPLVPQDAPMSDISPDEALS